MGTLFNLGRIEIQFNRPMDPAFITKEWIGLYQQVPGGFDLLNTRAGLTVTYDAPTMRAIIDFSSLSATDAPADGTYNIGIWYGVRDLQGNLLDGEFPTGGQPADA